MTSKTHILIVDDDRRLRELLSQFLSGEGYDVSVAEGATQAQQLMAQQTYDLLVVDVMMPEISGIELTAQIKAETPNLPILMLTALTEAENRIEGLESGADDYLAKPFEPRELVLRIQNLLKRGGSYNDPKNIEKYQFGDYVFMASEGSLKLHDSLINLSSTEANLLGILCKNMNELVKRDDLSVQMNNISERSVDVQIKRLRQKIEPNPKKPIHIKNVWGKGYLLRG